jgi:hypothetical protein
MPSPAPHYAAIPRPTSTPTRTATPRPTPTPVSVQIGATPLPVVVKSEADPVWMYWVPGLGIVISAVAALFAGLALKRIGRQIGIANDQIKIANQQIDLANEQIEIAKKQTQIADESLKATQQSVELAQKDFDATMEGLGIAKDQKQKFDEQYSRRPNVNVHFSGFETALIFDRQTQIIEFELFNAGSLMATNLNVEVYLPATFENLYNEDDLYDGVDVHSRPVADWQHSGDFDKFYFRRAIPSLNPRDHVKFGWIHAEIPGGVHEVWYYMTSEQGPFPTEADAGGFGHLTITVNQPPTA